MSLFKYFKKSPASSKVVKKEDNDFKLGDLVWAKLNDFPWWPCMVCKEPRSGKLFHDHENKMHVQFFGQPPTRDWVLKRLISVPYFYYSMSDKTYDYQR